MSQTQHNRSTPPVYLAILPQTGNQSLVREIQATGIRYKCIRYYRPDGTEAPCYVLAGTAKGRNLARYLAEEYPDTVRVVHVNAGRRARLMQVDAYTSALRYVALGAFLTGERLPRLGEYFREIHGPGCLDSYYHTERTFGGPVWPMPG